MQMWGLRCLVFFLDTYNRSLSGPKLKTWPGNHRFLSTPIKDTVTFVSVNRVPLESQERGLDEGEKGRKLPTLDENLNVSLLRKLGKTPFSS